MNSFGRWKLPGAVQDGQDPHDVAADVVDHPVIANDDFPRVEIVEFGNDATGFREAFQPVRGFKNIQDAALA